MVKIAFQHPQLDVRGSCVALYDYALYNETLLANQSVIVVDGRNKAKNNLCAVLKFTNRFPVFFYDDISELHDILIREGCDILYSIKYGRKNEVIFDDIKTVACRAKKTTGPTSQALERDVGPEIVLEVLVKPCLNLFGLEFYLDLR